MTIFVALLRSVVVIGLVSILAACGCKSKKLATYPVQGEVRIDGQPTPGVMVIFCPIDDAELVKNHRPTAISDEDGMFQLMTNEKDDGAPAGQYKVLLQWIADSAPTPAGVVKLGSDRLQGRYMNLDASQFTVAVKEEANELPQFELTSN